MDYNLKIFLSYFIFLSLLSCSNPNTKYAIERDKLITLSLNTDNKNAVPVDSILQEPTFIRLETTRSNLIGYISQLITLKNGDYLVVDNKISNSISIYNKKGKFKLKIGKRGMGPGEYISCYYVAMSPDNSTIAIYDDKASKMHLYSTKGQHIKSKKVPFTAVQFEYIDKNKLAFVGFANNNIENNNELIVTDNDFNIIYSSFKGMYRKNHFTYSVKKQLYKYNDNVFFCQSFSDTIFEIKSNKINSRYCICIEKFKRPKIDDKTTNKTMREYYKKYVSFDGSFYSNNTSSIFYISIPQSRSSFLYFDNVKKQLYKWNFQFSNPFFIFLNDNEVSSVTCDNEYASVLYPNDLLSKQTDLYNLLISNKFKKDKADKLYENLKIDDNPIIVTYKNKVNG